LLDTTSRSLAKIFVVLSMSETVPSMDDHPKSAMGRLYCPSSAISPWMSVSRREEAAHVRGSFLARWKLATFRTVVALSPMLESV